MKDFKVHKFGNFIIRSPIVYCRERDDFLSLLDCWECSLNKKLSVVDHYNCKQRNLFKVRRIKKNK